MKKFLEGAIEWKMRTCFIFTGSVFVTGIVYAVTGQSGITLLTLLGLLIVSAVGSLLQWLMVTDVLFKKMAYPLRICLFAVPFLAVLCGCAVWCGWFPAFDIVNWAVFVGIFLLMLAGITVGFEIYYRVTGRKYD